jgi:hypothetical protein
VDQRSGFKAKQRIRQEEHQVEGAVFVKARVEPIGNEIDPTTLDKVIGCGVIDFEVTDEEPVVNVVDYEVQQTKKHHKNREPDHPWLFPLVT